MLMRISRSVFNKNFYKSPSILVRNLHENGVALASNEYKVKEPASNPFIIMHGLFGSKNNWNSLCKAFAQKTSPPRNIISVDARNHGESPHTKDHDYDLMAEDIAKFLDDRKIKKASVLGHSMGGRAMMRFALKYPEMVEKLIVVDISPVSPIGTSRTNIPQFIRAMRMIQIPDRYTIHQGRSVADESLEDFIDEKPMRDFLITNLAKDEKNEFIWRVNLETLETCFEKNIAQFPLTPGLKFNGPTLFIGGSRSDYLIPSDKPKTLEIFPNAEFVYLDAGHWVHAEQPEDFMNVVLNFVNKV